jgi:hypothetical protein
MTKQFTIASLLAALTLLAAFAPVPTQAIGPAVESSQANVTVIYKTNPNWPVRGLITQDPCAVRACQAI